eukprot:Em0002g556a
MPSCPTCWAFLAYTEGTRDDLCTRLCSRQHLLLGSLYNFSDTRYCLAVVCKVQELQNEQEPVPAHHS